MSVTWPITGRLTVEYAVEGSALDGGWFLITSFPTRADARICLDFLTGQDVRYAVRIRQHLSQERR